LIIDSVTGLLVSPRDADGLAKAVEKLIRDKSLARKMGQRGAERVCQYFTLEQMAKKNEAHYYELLGAN
jgi:phosphatidylinositol alpha-1,6-mannosyltransferase